jgi:hypothetical protein
VTVVYLLFVVGIVIGLGFGPARLRSGGHRLQSSRGWPILAVVILGVWTLIVLGVSAYARLEAGNKSRIPAVLGIGAGIVGLAAVLRAIKIQRDAQSWERQG